jgi:hypothetical protein
MPNDATKSTGSNEALEKHRRRIKEWDRQKSAHAKAVVDACKSGDAERFYDLAYPYDEYPDFWPLAVRAIARSISEVTPEIQEKFREVWIETKMLTSGVDNQPALCKALRILIPKYTGESLRLYRGASARERRRAAYGISWTSNLTAAREFAESYRAWPGGSVILETVAPPEAIIGMMEYPPPLTEADKAELGLSPDTRVTEYHEECEYLVDRRLLGPIKVWRRYAERSVEDGLAMVGQPGRRP